MALTANIVRTAVSADGSESTWVDQTVYGSGNPDAADVGIFLDANKVDEQLVSSPLIVTPTLGGTTYTGYQTPGGGTFITKNGADGNTQYLFVIVPIWVTGTGVYIVNDMVVFNNLAYKCIQAVSGSSTDPATDIVNWVSIVDPITLIGSWADTNNWAFQVQNKVLDFNTATCLAKLGIRDAQENCSDDCGCGGGDCNCNNKTARTFSRVRSLLFSMRLDEAQQLFTAGERAARLAEKYCSDCGCLTR